MTILSQVRRNLCPLVCLFVAALLSVPEVRACSWSYPIWGLRSKSADPLFRFTQNGKLGYVDATGKIVIRPTLPVNADYFSGEFHEGLLQLGGEKGPYYVDRSGRLVFQLDSWFATNFAGGLAAAASPDSKTPRHGFIDRTGRFAIPPRFYSANSFSDGLALVAETREFGDNGYIDERGKYVIPPRLTYGTDFHEGRAAVIAGGPCRLTNGGSCSRAEFVPNSLFACYDCRFSIIDKSGKPVSNLRFDDVADFSEGLAPVRIGPRWGFADRSGRLAISPSFGYAEPFSEGLAAVRVGEKVGFIDRSGKLVIDARFESVGNFSSGRALVGQLGPAGRFTYHFIDRSGAVAFPGEFSVATSFNHGLAHVETAKGKLAWIDPAGKVVFAYTAD